MLRVKEKELKLAESVMCSQCDYMYAPYANYCDICRELFQMTIICPDCEKAEIFTGEQTKELACSGCNTVLPDTKKIMDVNTSESRLEYYRQGDTNEPIVAV